MTLVTVRGVASRSAISLAMQLSDTEIEDDARQLRLYQCREGLIKMMFSVIMAVEHRPWHESVAKDRIS